MANSSGVPKRAWKLRKYILRIRCNISGDILAVVGLLGILILCDITSISEEFVAHGASVNCVSLGHKSGRVLVTGGDDKKVNLWAVGKPNCIMVSC